MRLRYDVEALARLRAIADCCAGVLHLLDGPANGKSLELGTSISTSAAACSAFHAVRAVARAIVKGLLPWCGEAGQAVDADVHHAARR